MYQLGSQKTPAHSIRVSCGGLIKRLFTKMWSRCRETTRDSTAPQNCGHAQAQRDRGRKSFLESRKRKSCKRTTLREAVTSDQGCGQPEVARAEGSQGNKYPPVTLFLSSSFWPVLPIGQTQWKSAGLGPDATRTGQPPVPRRAGWRAETEEQTDGVKGEHPAKRYVYKDMLEREQKLSAREGKVDRVCVYHHLRGQGEPTRRKLKQPGCWCCSGQARGHGISSLGLRLVPGPGRPPALVLCDSLNQALYTCRSPPTRPVVWAGSPRAFSSLQPAQEAAPARPLSSHPPLNRPLPPRPPKAPSYQRCSRSLMSRRRGARHAGRPRSRPPGPAETGPHLMDT